MTITVRAGGLYGYRTLMQQLGVDPLPLLQRYRIVPQALDDGEAPLPLRSVVQLLEASAEITACADFGLRLSAVQDISVLGHLAIAMRNAQTMAEALQIISRYLFVHSTGMSVSVQRERGALRHGAEVRFELDVPGARVLRQAIDVCLGDVHRILQLLAGDAYELQAVALPHQPLAPLITYSRFFGAPVLAAQPHAALLISERTYQLRFADTNPALQQLAMDYLREQVADPTQSMAMRVRRLLRRTIGTGPNDKVAIAALLAMHPRTLQRHLAAEGTQFERVRDEVQRELAHRYLCETRIPLTRLASLLGYAEQAVLSRACQRWFGQPPSVLRKTALATAGVAPSALR